MKLEQALRPPTLTSSVPILTVASSRRTVYDTAYVPERAERETDISKLNSAALQFSTGILRLPLERSLNANSGRGETRMV